VPIASQEENAGSDPQYPCCTFRGNVVALECRESGTEIWRSFTVPEAKPTKRSDKGVQYYGPSGATVWSSPPSICNATCSMSPPATGIPIRR